MANTKIMVSVSDSLSAISDDKSLALFNAIALANISSSFLMAKFHLTRKQYYSRISGLSDAGLIKREKGKYILTSFGTIVYKAQELIGHAVELFSKLKAIDSIDSLEFPHSERNKLIDALINKGEIKKILIKIDHESGHHSGNSTEKLSTGLMPPIYSIM